MRSRGYTKSVDAVGHADKYMQTEGTPRRRMRSAAAVAGRALEKMPPWTDGQTDGFV